MEKVTVMVPAHNEADILDFVLNPLLKWRNVDPKNRLLIVVDDGSTDGTAEFARKKGVRVIKSDPVSGKNLGKGQAFLSGVNFAEKNGCEIIVTLDADVIRLEPQDVDFMISELRQSGKDMLVAPQIEGVSMGELIEESGQRAVKIKSLTPEIRKHLLGFGLEPALNHFLTLTVANDLIIRTLPPSQEGGALFKTDARCKGNKTKAKGG